MRPRHIVVIGASAGGIEALSKIVAGLPAEFPAAVAVVMHTSPHSPPILHDILARCGQLSVVSPSDMEPLRAGIIYVAPPDFHLLIEPGHVRLTKGPKENRFRPAVDPLFRSAAQVFGPNTIGVVLTGNLDDGAAGLWAIKELGGVAIVQDPKEAMHPSMPKSAIEAVDVDHVASLADIPALLVQVTSTSERDDAAQRSAPVQKEVDVANQRDPLQAGVRDLGAPSYFTCPECHGVLLQRTQGRHFQFRCHTGHAYSVESLLVEIQDQIEVQLWNAIRAIQEGDVVMRMMAEHVDELHGRGNSIALRERAELLQRQADDLRQMLFASAAPIRTN